MMPGIHKLDTHIPVKLVRFAKTPGSSCVMPLPCSCNMPVHAGALQDGLRVSMPWAETKKLQSDDSHVKACTMCVSLQINTATFYNMVCV